MSKIRFTLFRMLSPELAASAGVDLSDYIFSYRDSNGFVKSISKKDSSDQDNFEIPGKDCQWNPETDGFIIQRACTVNRPKLLFDLSTGISCPDSELGIALVLLSRDSSQRQVFPYQGSITNQVQPCELVLEAIVPAQTYRCSVELKTIIYLKKSGSSDIPFLCNKEGTVLGPLSITRLYMEEQSPEFPTRVIKLGHKEPLWKLEMNWDDPRVDSFDESVRVIINESYPGYNEIWGIKADEKKKNALKVEIYSSAMVAVIEKVRENKAIWEDTVKPNVENLKDGSISDYLCYLFNVVLGKHNMDTNELSLALRKRLGERE